MLCTVGLAGGGGWSVGQFAMAGGSCGAQLSGRGDRTRTSCWGGGTGSLRCGAAPLRCGGEGVGGGGT